MLRENWSSTMISASRPSGVPRQSASSPAMAACRVAPKRRPICASSAASFMKRCLGCSSANQKSSTVCALATSA